MTVNNVRDLLLECKYSVAVETREEMEPRHKAEIAKKDAEIKRLIDKYEGGNKAKR